MNLGETIYNLRKEKKLSQGDLAEQLSVSRQSVSKWENNSAVPDLDKLVKLSTIFGVSLDELVKGEMPAGEADNGGQAAEAEHTDTAKSIITKRFIVGMVLMGVGAIVGIMSMFLLGSIMALIFSLPFTECQNYYTPKYRNRQDCIKKCTDSDCISPYSVLKYIKNGGKT